MPETNLPEPRDPYLAMRALERVLVKVDTYSAEIGNYRVEAQTDYIANHPGRGEYWFKVTWPAEQEIAEAPAPSYVRIDSNGKSGGRYTELPSGVRREEVVTISSPALAPFVLGRRLEWLIGQIPPGLPGFDPERERENLFHIRRNGDQLHVKWDMGFVTGCFRDFARVADPAGQMRPFCAGMEESYRGFRFAGRSMSMVYLLTDLLERYGRRVHPWALRGKIARMESRKKDTLDRNAASVIYDVVHEGGASLVMETIRDLMGRADGLFSDAKAATSHAGFVGNLYHAFPLYDAAYYGIHCLLADLDTFRKKPSGHWVPPDPPIDEAALTVRRNFCDERKARISTTLRIDVDTWNDVRALPYRRAMAAAAKDEGPLALDQLMVHWLKVAMYFPRWWEPYFRGEADHVSLEAPPGSPQDRRGP